MTKLMQHFIRPERLLVAALVTAAAIGPVAAAGHAHPRPPKVPTEVAVPDGNKLYLEGHAVGVQIYSCNATPTGYAYALVAPRANLYDRHGKLIITHFAGPTWQAKDGSKVVGARVAGVNVDPTAIDWLLLSAASTSAGPKGDTLADTTFIQRLNTTGGRPPAAANCDATTVGTQAEVPYTADYFFWKARGCHAAHTPARSAPARPS
jgi:hypothetical protein